MLILQGLPFVGYRGLTVDIQKAVVETYFTFYFPLQTKGDRPLEDIIAEHTSKLQKKSLLFSGSNTQLSSLQKVSHDRYCSSDPTQPG